MSKLIKVNGAKLRSLRLRRALSLRDLGKESGVAFDSIHRLERGSRRAQTRTLRRLAEALDVEIEELTKGEEEETW